VHPYGPQTQRSFSTGELLLNRSGFPTPITIAASAEAEKVNETSRMVATEEAKKKKSSANKDVKRQNIRVERTPWLRNDFQRPSSPGTIVLPGQDWMI
jgi:hypothetical protein